MKITNLLSLFFIALLLSGCFSNTDKYKGLRFPQTSSSDITFQEQSIPAECTAFAHLLMNTKTGSTGKEIGAAMHKEAEEKGADLILVGMARELSDEDFDTDRFDYYGPQYAYNFDRTWLGWKFGFSEWTDAGDLVGLGADVWNNTEPVFDNSVLVQAVFLQCN